MTSKQKIAIGIGGLSLAAIIGYVFYRRRWRNFKNIGDSQWLGTKYNDGRLALLMEDPNHGIAVGSSIEIDHANSVTPKGKAQVLDVVVNKDGSYLITNLKAPYENPDFAGKVRVV